MLVVHANTRVRAKLAHRRTRLARRPQVDQAPSEDCDLFVGERRRNLARLPNKKHESTTTTLAREGNAKQNCNCMARPDSTMHTYRVRCTEPVAVSQECQNVGSLIVREQQCTTGGSDATDEKRNHRQIKQSYTARRTQNAQTTTCGDELHPEEEEERCTHASKHPHTHSKRLAAETHAPPLSHAPHCVRRASCATCGRGCVACEQRDGTRSRRSTCFHSLRAKQKVIRKNVRHVR